MAMTLASAQTEARAIFNEASTTANGIFTDAFVIQVHSMFLDEMEVELEFPIEPISYTWAAAATAVAMSSMSSSLMSIRLIEVLDDDGNFDYVIDPKPRNSDEGFFIWNEKVYLNGYDSDGPDAAVSMRILGFRSGTRISATSSNIECHANNERAVFLPYLLWLGSLRAKKIAMAEGYRKMFDTNFKNMKRKRQQQTNPEFESWAVSDDYAPLTG